jgi:hypothetical protein
MTERERWIVYPLLFLALGAALRDKLIDRTTTRSIVCQELIVVDEQPLGRDAILLARIGRPERASSGRLSGGELLLNGQIEVVDRAPIPNQAVRRLVTIGGSEPTPGAPRHGYVVVNGNMAVDGAINAKFYAYQGIPFMPALFPGVSLPELLRALPQAVAPNQANPQPQAAPPVEQAPPTEPSADASERPQGSPPEQPPSEAKPLADPDENR